MLSWTDWPARRHPARSAFAAVVVVSVTGVVLSMDPVLGFVGALLLLASVREALFPTRFSLTDDGVRLDNPLLSRARRWDVFGGWSVVDDGFRLRGRGSSPWLQRRHDLVLRCPDHLDAVGAELRARLGDPA